MNSIAASIKLVWEQSLIFAAICIQIKIEEQKDKNDMRDNRFGSMMLVIILAERERVLLD